MKAMILAAGAGTRLRPLTERVPKPMLYVGGKPLLQHVVEWLVCSGIRDLVINLHHRPETITGHFCDGADFGARITYSHEQKLLGTAGAIKKVEEHFPGTFLLVYGDNLTTCNLARLSDFHSSMSGLASVALFRREDVSQSGVAELDDDDRILRFVEKPLPGQALSHWVSAGVLLLEPEILRMIPEGRPSDIGRDILPAILAGDQGVYGYRMGEDEGLWWIDTPDDYRQVSSAWKGGILK